MALHVEFDYYSNNPLIRISGMSDLSAIDKIQAAIALHFRSGFPRFYLDLAGIEYVDSMLVSTLLNLHLQYMKAGTPMVLLNLSQRMANVLVATGLDRVLQLEEQQLPSREVFAGTLPT